MSEIQVALIESVSRNNLVALSILIKNRAILPNTGRKRQPTVYLSLI